MSEHIKKMHQLACQVREHSYSPFSHFKVGACLRSKDNHFFVGCNIENAAFPDGQCAEACAIGSLVSAGYHEISEVLIVADSNTICAPCGSCRQKLCEFTASDVLIHLCDLNGLRKTMTMQELLPASFSATTMEK